jgi:class 3 adenylate cyclase
MSVSPPTGTVTFLYTDVEDSTGLAQKYPVEMPALLAQHHTVLRQPFKTWDIALQSPISWNISISSPRNKGTNHEAVFCGWKRLLDRLRRRVRAIKPVVLQIMSGILGKMSATLDIRWIFN